LPAKILYTGLEARATRFSSLDLNKTPAQRPRLDDDSGPWDHGKQREDGTGENDLSLHEVVMVLVVAVALSSVLAVTRMPIDILPNLNPPVVYVCQPYGGMDPAQMEGLLTNYYEYRDRARTAQDQSETLTIMPVKAILPAAYETA